MTADSVQQARLSSQYAASGENSGNSLSGRPLAELTRRPAAVRALAKTMDFMVMMKRVLWDV